MRYQTLMPLISQNHPLMQSVILIASSLSSVRSARGNVRALSPLLIATANPMKTIFLKMEVRSY